MTERIQKLYDIVRNTRQSICSTKATLFTKGFKMYEADPGSLRTAKAAAYMLERIPVWILDGEMIVGANASQPLGLEADYWSRGVWSAESVESIREERGSGTYYVSDKDADELIELCEYWRPRSNEHRMFDMYNEDMWKWKMSGFQLPRPANKDQAAGSGLAIGSMSFLSDEASALSIDYGDVMRKGLRYKIDECKKELANFDPFTYKFQDAEDVDRVYTLQAMIAHMEGVITWANRHADLAEKMAAECDDPKRKEELLLIAANSRRVPEFPPETFLQALQFQWMIYVNIVVMNVTPIGRADQYLYPYYKADLEAGRIDRETALEYLQLFRLKYYSIRTTSGGGWRQKWSGQATWRNVTLGGVDSDGNDATNDLTYMFMEAAQLCPTPHHNWRGGNPRIVRYADKLAAYELCPTVTAHAAGICSVRFHIS